MSISINAGFHLGSAVAIDDRLYLAKADFLTINENIYPDYALVVCKDDGSLWVFDKSAVADPINGKFKAFASGDDTVIQMSVMPTADETTVDKVYQYIGATDAEFVQGYWYIGVDNGDGTYSWVQINTQPIDCQVEVLPTPDVAYAGKIYQYIGETTDVEPIYIKGHFYECVEDTDVADTYKWAELSTTSLSANLTEEIEANVEVGGVKVGDVLTTEMDLTAIFKKMLVKYFPPTITLASTPTNKIIKKGETVTGIELSATVTKKSNEVTEVEFLKDGVSLELLNTDVSDGGVFTHACVDDITVDTTYTATATDGTEKNEASVKYVFVNPYYNGTCDDVTALTDFTGMNEVLEVKGKKVVSYTADNQYLVFAYDSSYGELTSVIDMNGFENLTAFSKSTIEVDGVTYALYSTQNKVTCSNFKYTFVI